MDIELVENVARAVLYEGYLLYPYRPSAVKNRQRWNFGTLVPPAFAPLQGDMDYSHAEVLALGDSETRLEVRVRFLHLQQRDIEKSVSSARPGNQAHYTLQQAIEREVKIPATALQYLATKPPAQVFSFAGGGSSEQSYGADGQPAGRMSLVQHPIDMSVRVTAEPLGGRLFKIAVRTCNLTALDARNISRDEALLRSMASAHLVLGIHGGEFISLVDPPPEFAEAAAQCRNKGLWPVLAGHEGERDCMLCSPIILYDHPRVAPESAGDLFDSTEIDELLTLRIRTLTDAEKREMAEADEQGRRILEQAESLSPEQMMALHGTMRSSASLSVRVSGIDLKAGDRVRLRPRAGGDAFDIVLAGRTATIESIEQDLEGRFHIAVTVDDDPGKDLGLSRQPGHRFFFSPAEVEPA